MSEPPVGVAVVRDGIDETVIAQSMFDSREDALEAVDILMQFWPLDGEHHIEIRRR